jgi:hypothetical protein
VVNDYENRFKNEKKNENSTVTYYSKEFKHYKITSPEKFCREIINK